MVVEIEISWLEWLRTPVWGNQPRVAGVVSACRQLGTPLYEGVWQLHAFCLGSAWLQQICKESNLI
jgi:hypothetical protein